MGCWWVTRLVATAPLCFYGGGMVFFPHSHEELCAVENDQTTRPSCRDFPIRSEPLSTQISIHNPMNPLYRSCVLPIDSEDMIFRRIDPISNQNTNVDKGKAPKPKIRQGVGIPRPRIDRQQTNTKSVKMQAPRLHKATASGQAL
jgi:hypothetical protein